VRGYVPKDELVRLYQRAVCLVFPSRYEGFGLTPAEAMACGTPVVARPDPAVREVVGDAGVITDDLADGVRRALRERPALRAAGLERAKLFTWEETARRTADVYRRFPCESRRSSSPTVTRASSRARCRLSRRRSTSCS
jgi:glycosyltransferase involved in cell wall biosynthesis